MRLWLKPSFAGLFSGWSWFRHRPWHAHRRAGRRCGAGSVRQRMADRIGHRLRLDDAQRERLAVLLQRLEDQRQALASGDWRGEVLALVKDDSFDRWLAEDLLNSRVQALRHHGPAVIAALADFHDALDERQREQVRAKLARWVSHG